jgi:LysM repeat protein
MNDFSNRTIRLHLLPVTIPVAMLLLLLSGCITVTPPVEEPSPLEPLLPTATSDEIAGLFPAATRTPVGFRPRSLDAIVEAYERASVTRTRTPFPTETALPSSTPTATPVPTLYEVVEGDTLGVISEKFEVSVVALMAANNLTDADTLTVGQQLVIPSASQIVQVVAEQGTPIPTPHTESGDIIHYVQVGETLSAIAARYGIDRMDLLMANGIRPDVQLYAGDTLIIPVGDYIAVPTATATSFVATSVPTVQVALAPTETPPPAPTTAPQATPTPASSVYTIKEGDYARTVAEAHGITMEALIAANPGTNMENLSIGQQLVIPPAPPGVATATATPTSITLEPTATATVPPPVMATHIVAAGDTVESIASRYGISPEVLQSYNEGLGESLTEDSILQIPLGTPTPSPSPTLPPTTTPTPAPAYLAPVLLLPADDSTYAYWEGQAALQLVWTSTGILQEDEFYVVRLRSVDEDGNVLWSRTEWTKNPSWRLPADLLQTIDDQSRLRWDVTVMRRTSAADAAVIEGVALSERSATFELTFVISQQ